MCGGFCVNTTRKILIVSKGGFDLIPNSRVLNEMSKLLPCDNGVLVTAHCGNLFVCSNRAIRGFGDITSDFVRRGHIFYTTLGRSLLTLNSIRSKIYLLSLRGSRVGIVSVGDKLRGGAILDVSFSTLGGL